MQQPQGPAGNSAATAAAAALQAAAGAEHAALQAAQAASDAAAAAAAAAGRRPRDAEEPAESYPSRLMARLPTDIFSLTVQALLGGTRGWSLWKVLLSLFLTVGIQIGMLALLFNSSVQGTWAAEKAKVSETDKLWLQMGMVQRQVCWMEHNVEMNKSAVGTAGDCLLAWPSDAGCALTNRSNIFSRAEQAQALQNLTSEYGMAAACSRYASAEQFAALNCSTFLEETLDPGTYQFGAGLFSNDTASTANAKPMRGGWAGGAGSRPFVPHAQCLLTPEQTTADVQYPPDKDPMFVSMVTLLFMAVYAQIEFVNAIWLAYVAAVQLGAAPAFWFPKHVVLGGQVPFTSSSACGLPHCIAKCLVLLVPLIQVCTALAVLLSSMSMSYILDQNVDTYLILITYAAFAFVIAVDDLIGGLLVNEASWRAWRAVWSKRPTQKARDRPVMPATQQSTGIQPGLSGKQALASCGDSSSNARRKFDKPGTCSTGKQGAAGPLGWFYFGVVGLCLLVEPMLLSPQICAVMFSLAKINDGWAATTSESLAAVAGDRQGLMDLINSWMLSGIANTGWANYNAIIPIDPAEDPVSYIIGLAFLYPVLVVLFVLLWGGNCLGCRSRLWPLVLLLMQAFLAAWPMIVVWFGSYGLPGMMASMQAQTAARLGMPPDYNLHAMLAAQVIILVLPLVLAWTGMFVVWPAMQARRTKSKQGHTCMLKNPA